jgi:hypothetical protein
MPSYLVCKFLICCATRIWHFQQRILQNINVFSKISKESTSFYYIHEKYSVSSTFLYNGNSKCYVVKNPIRNTKLTPHTLHLIFVVSSFTFVVIKGPSLVKIISARNQDIIMVYEAVIKVDIYGVVLANTHAQL